ncbi:hypothetical protein LSAT2_003263, partial [Lamellibrachia satsuma]
TVTPLVLHLNVTRHPPRASPQRHTPPPSCFTSTSHATPLVLHLNVTRHPPRASPQRHTPP